MTEKELWGAVDSSILGVDTGNSLAFYGRNSYPPDKSAVMGVYNWRLHCNEKGNGIPRHYFP